MAYSAHTCKSDRVRQREYIRIEILLVILLFFAREGTEIAIKLLSLFSRPPRMLQRARLRLTIPWLIMINKDVRDRKKGRGEVE